MVNKGLLREPEEVLAEFFGEKQGPPDVAIIVVDEQTGQETCGYCGRVLSSPKKCPACFTAAAE